MDASRLKEARLGKFRTQDDFARAVGVDKQTVWRWEKGERKPRYDMLPKISSLLGVSVAYLMGDEDAEAAARVEAAAKDNLSGNIFAPEQNAPPPPPLSITEVAAFTDRARASAAQMTPSDRALLAHLLRNCAEYIEDTSEDLRTDGVYEPAASGEGMG